MVCIHSKQSATWNYKLTVNTVKKIVASFERVWPDYVNHLDFASLTTLVVEKVFAEMRKGKWHGSRFAVCPQIVINVRRKSEASTKCSFNCFTTSSSYYSKPTDCLPLSDIPSMPKPERNCTVTKRQLDKMRKWREDGLANVLLKSPWETRAPKIILERYRLTITVQSQLILNF